MSVKVPLNNTMKGNGKLKQNMGCKPDKNFKFVNNQIDLYVSGERKWTLGLESLSILLHYSYREGGRNAVSLSLFSGVGGGREAQGPIL